MRYYIGLTGQPEQTQRIVAGDAVKVLINEVTLNSANPVIGVLITCEGSDIRFALGGVNPTQGVSGVGHILYADQSLKLTGTDAIQSFRFINKTNGSNGTIQVTVEYAP